MRSDDLEQIYQLYYKDVFLYALSFCKDEHVADSLTSDTFYKALMHMEHIPEHMKPWLLRVCKNSYLDMLRKNKGLQWVEMEHLGMTCAEDSLDNLLCNERNKNLYKAIIKLEKPYRECILLFYFLDYSMSEVAKSMQMSVGAVRTAVHRARKMLKELLKEEN